MKFQFYEIKRAEFDQPRPFGRTEVTFVPLLREPLEYPSGETALSAAYDRFDNLGRRLAVQEIYVKPVQKADASNGGDQAFARGSAREAVAH